MHIYPQVPPIPGDVRAQQNLPPAHPLRTNSSNLPDPSTLTLKTADPSPELRALQLRSRRTIGWGRPYPEETQRSGQDSVWLLSHGKVICLGKTADESNFLTSRPQGDSLTLSLASRKGSSPQAAMNSQPQKACGWLRDRQTATEALPPPTGEWVRPDPGSSAPPHPRRQVPGFSLFHGDTQKVRPGLGLHSRHSRSIC